MANTRISLPLQQVLSSGGKPIVGAKLYVYATGTTTLMTTHSNPTLTTANTNPLIADANGIFGEIFGAIGTTYDLVYKTAFDVLIKTFTGITNSSTFDANGNLKADTADTNNYHVIQKSGVSEGDGVLVVGGRGASAPSFSAFSVQTDDSNSTATALKVRKNSTTNRSINAVGTINASGADYAEYCKKSPTCGNIAKGEVVGRDINGELTQKFSESLSFCIKSTDPSYVGNDIYSLVTDEERAQVDRIAFCGQVPLNNNEAPFKVGNYAIAVIGINDTIALKFVTYMSTLDTANVVGRVVAIASDGRPIVKVM